MDSSTWNWSEALKALHLRCQFCDQEIVPVGLLNLEGDNLRLITSWAHTGKSSSIHQTEPVYHTLTNDEIERLGYRNGMSGALLLDNPFCASGPLNDGADSMSEALVWWKGWRDSQAVLGKVPEGEPTAQPNGFDYLEAQRG